MYELSDDPKNLSERLEYGEITPAEYDQIKADLLASKPTTETPKKQSKAWIPIAVIVGVVLLVIFANQATVRPAANKESRIPPMQGFAVSE